MRWLWSGWLAVVVRWSGLLRSRFGSVPREELFGSRVDDEVFEREGGLPLVRLLSPLCRLLLSLVDESWLWPLFLFE